ncbi:thiamine-binding protein [Sediminibacterium sp.]|uniref:thiamine-binding protein n=1 Tax=Sediminibacterium sp. TaxID=1917865 RepID=UPI0025FE1584|nr:thiamine-binding protein [Sediminibacterium sp.]MBW0178449.1 thiamine-binding protein [Sediminibacterium sp.]
MNHPFIVSAAIQLVPIQTGSRHPYEWIDEVIEIIKSAGLSYQVGPFSTSIDADYKSVMNVIDKINQYLLSKNCTEWLLNVQIQVRSGSDITSSEKVDKHLN